MMVDKKKYPNKHYSEFLKGLTEEERTEHLQERAENKENRRIKAVMSDMINSKSGDLSKKLLDKMIEHLDDTDKLSPAMIAVLWDRLVGKETQEVDVTSGGEQLSFNITLKGDDDGPNSTN